MSNFLSENELKSIGIKRYGSNVLISRDAKFYSPHFIEVGDNVRIDDFCILSGNIKIKDYVHISAYASIFAGNEGVEIESYVSISSRCAIYAISDDYSGMFLANPMVPLKCRKVIEKKFI